MSCIFYPPPLGEKRWHTHFSGQLQHFMILRAIIQYCVLKVGNFSTSCFCALCTRTDVPGDLSGPLYCVHWSCFAILWTRVLPYPFLIFTTAFRPFPTWSPPEVLKYLCVQFCTPVKFCPDLLLYEVIGQFLYRPEFRF